MKNPHFTISLAFDAPFRGVPVGMSAPPFVKTIMVSLPDSEKNFEDMFIRFDVIHERDGLTDRQTLRDSKDRAYASHRTVKMNIKIVQNKL